MRSVVCAIVVVLLALPGLAAAQAPPDTVFLANGGRVRGTVVEEQPGVGVTVLLANRTVRRIPAAAVARVEYASDAAPSTRVSAAEGAASAPATTVEGGVGVQAIAPGTMPVPPPAVAARPGSVPVRFEPSGYEVSVVDATSRSLGCTTPCELRLDPGLASLSIRGGAEFSTFVTLPASPARVEVSRRSAGMFWTGTIMMAVGGALSLGGAMMLDGPGVGLILVGLALEIPGLIVYLLRGSDEAEVETL